MAADKLNNVRKYVFSKTLLKVDSKNSTIISNDIVKKVIELKNLAGPEIQVHGSSNLIQILLKHGLIDEFWVWILPPVIDTGKHLFGEATIPAGLTLLDSKISTIGGLLLPLMQRIVRLRLAHLRWKIQ